MTLVALGPADGRTSWTVAGAGRLLAVYIGKEVRGQGIASFSQSVSAGHAEGLIGDQVAAFVKDNPVRPENLLATVDHALGIDPESEINDREGRPHRVSDGKAVTALLG